MVSCDTEFCGKVDREEDEHADAHDEEKTTNKDCDEAVSCPMGEAILARLFSKHTKVSFVASFLGLVKANTCTHRKNWSP